MFSVMFYKLKCIILHILYVKCEIVRNGICNRLLNGKMPKVVEKKDSTPEIFSLLWDLTRSQKFGMYTEHKPRAWNPALHNYFFSMQTVLVLFFYKTVEVIVLAVSLLQHLPRKGRLEFNAFLMDTFTFAVFHLRREHPNH